MRRTVAVCRSTSRVHPRLVASWISCCSAAEALTQAWRVFAGGEELAAAQIQVTLAQALRPAAADSGRVRARS